MNDIQNSLRLPEPQLRARAKSWHNLNVRELPLTGILKRRNTQWASILDLTQEDDTHLFDNYEIFYKITDIVLIICAVVFIISAIASITLWISGIILIDFVKDVLSGTRKNLTNSQRWS